MFKRLLLAGTDTGGPGSGLSGPGGGGTEGDGIVNKALPDFYNTQGVNAIAKFITSSIGIVFIVAIVSFMFLIAWGAVQWITSGGDKGALQAAQSKITNAIIGLVVLFATYALLATIGYFFNIPALQLPFILDLSGLKIQ